MLKREKREFFIFVIAVIFLILFSHFSFAKEVIQVPAEPQQPQKPQGILASIGQILTSPWFIGFIIIILAIIIFSFIVYWVIRLIIKYYKLQNDAIYRIRCERIKLAMAQRRKTVNHSFLKFWSYPKDYPIRLAKIDENGKLRISNPIAYYRGDFQSHEGNLCIVFNMDGNHHLWGLIPETELIIIPNRKEMKIKSLNEKTEMTEEITIKNIPVADDIVQFNENELLIYAEGISNAGYFYYPVLKAKDGNLINLSVPVYESIKEVALNNLMYVQTDLFSQVSKKIIDLNPYARYSNKVNDNNQSVEVPTSSSSGGGGQ